MVNNNDGPHFLSLCPCSWLCTFFFHYGQDSLSVTTLYLDTELSHVTSFAQCNVTRKDANRGLKSVCVLVLSLLNLCHHHEDILRLTCYRTRADSLQAHQPRSTCSQPNPRSVSKPNQDQQSYLADLQMGTNAWPMNTNCRRLQTWKTCSTWSFPLEEAVDDVSLYTLLKKLSENWR